VSLVCNRLSVVGAAAQVLFAAQGWAEFRGGSVAMKMVGSCSAYPQKCYHSDQSTRLARVRRTVIRSWLLWTTCMLAIQLSTSAQSVTGMKLKDFAERGVRLIGSGDPEFSQLVGAALRGVDASAPHGDPTRVGALEPLTVVLMNETSNAIIGYSIVWIGTDATGQEQREPRIHMQPYALKHGNTLGYDAKQRGGVLPPNCIKVLTPLGAFDEQSSISMSSSDQEMAEFAAGFQGSEPEVQLDAVIFDDGTVIGPDANHLMETFGAYLAAKNDVLGYLLEPTNMMNEISSQFELLTEHVSPRVHDGVSLNFREQYEKWKAQFAFELSSIQKVAGNGALGKYVSREYPVYIGVRPLRRIQ
jgi:hypothetical protein